jgi:hypothetical protein
MRSSAATRIRHGPSCFERQAMIVGCVSPEREITTAWGLRRRANQLQMFNLTVACEPGYRR